MLGPNREEKYAYYWDLPDDESSLERLLDAWALGIYCAEPGVF